MERCLEFRTNTINCCLCLHSCLCLNTGIRCLGLHIVLHCFELCIMMIAVLYELYIHLFSHIESVLVLL